MEHDSPEGFMRERDALNRLLTSKADRVIKRFLSIDSLAYGEGALKADVKELLGLTASAVLRFVRAGQVMSAAVLEKSAGEVLEFVLGGTSPACGPPLAEVAFPPGVIVGAVVRNQEVFIPDGRFSLAEGDVAVVFTLPESLREVEKLFAPRKRA